MSNFDVGVSGELNGLTGAIAAALGVMPDRLLRAPDGSQMDGFPGMTRDDYEDSVAVAGRLLRQVLQKMPEADREEYEALRRSDEEAIRERDEAEKTIRRRDEALGRGEDV